MTIDGWFDDKKGLFYNYFNALFSDLFDKFGPIFHDLVLFLEFFRVVQTMGQAGRLFANLAMLGRVLISLSNAEIVFPCYA